MKSVIYLEVDDSDVDYIMDKLKPILEQYGATAKVDSYLSDWESYKEQEDKDWAIEYKKRYGKDLPPIE